VSTRKNTRPDYGVDTASAVLRFMVLAFMGMIFALSSPYLVHQRELAIQLASLGRTTAIWCSICATALVWGSRSGKLRLRDRVIAGLALKGSEQVLDVGCGRGLLLVAAAKKLDRGKAIGLDLFVKGDPTGNSEATTRENATLEGVDERIELVTGDARKLPFPSKRFDVIVSSFALHEVREPADRQKAIAEIARVLKPGGRVRIVDTRHTEEYATALREAGLVDVARSGMSFVTIVPSRIVSARRPVA
jgi:SAM-dependent methyltransferase